MESEKYTTSTNTTTKSDDSSRILIADGQVADPVVRYYCYLRDSGKKNPVSSDKIYLN